MATEIALPASFGTGVSTLFQGAAGNDELGAGIQASYAIVGIKGKVWSIRFGGEEKQLMREDGDGARGSIEVVIVKAASAISKIYYENGYVDGANQAPDCWSANGVTPDASVQKKVNKTCADCPMNAWGSRVTDAGKNGKMCADSRRIAVVPLEDLNNDLFGGPMLLRVPAASLKDLKAYGDLLSSYQFPYFAVGTRIAFDPKEAFPKFVLTAMRPLTDNEAQTVLELREDKRTTNLLNEAFDTSTVAAAGTGSDVPATPFEQGAGDKPLSEQAKAPAPTGTKPKPTTATKPKPTTAAGPTPEQIADKAAADKAAADKAAADKAAADKAAADKVRKDAIAKKKAEMAAEMARLEAEEAGEDPAGTAGGDGAIEDAEIVDEETGEVTGVGNFDSMLDSLMKG